MLGYSTRVVAPEVLLARCWPHVRFYDKQWEIIRSVEENFRTVVVAGNELGKDFVTAFTVLWYFLSRHPVRIVTTSADGPQLEAVLWGEMRRFIQTSRLPLDADKGGPIVVNHLHLRKRSVETGEVCGLSYCLGRVSKKGEGILGHHIAEVGDGVPRTLFVSDEASGVDDVTFNASETWAKRQLLIGNPYECQNQFRRSVKQGDVPHAA